MKDFIFIDFEFNNTSEKNVNLVCCAIHDFAKDIKRTWWLHNDEEQQKDLANYLHRNKNKIFVAHSVVAEASSFMALGLKPTKFYWIDTFIEFRMITNHYTRFQYGKHYIKGQVKTLMKPVGYKAKAKSGGKLTHSLPEFLYKFAGIETDVKLKDEMRDLILTNKEFNPSEREAILKYCLEDVVHLHKAVGKLLGVYKDLKLDNMNNLLWRGETAARTAIMERLGYPINYTEVRNFSRQVPQLLKEVERDINYQFPDILPFEYSRLTGKNVKKEKKLREWIENLPKKTKEKWKLTDKGQYSLSLDAFQEHYQYRHSYPRNNFGAQMVRYLVLKQGLNGFLPPKKGGKCFWDSVGSDKRVRPYINCYGSMTSRFQPSATGFMFLKAAWIRKTVHPEKGKMIVGIDYKSEEFLISAIVSGDKKMYEAYCTGDVYFAFAKDSKMVPINAIRKDYEAERQAAKSSVLGLSYRMSKYGLSAKLTQDTNKVWTEEKAQAMINLFEGTYSTHTQHIKLLLNQYRKERKRLTGRDGWTLFLDNDNDRSVGNYPIQSMGSVILRKAIQLCQDSGLQVIFPLHDALYIECDVNDWEIVDVFAGCMYDAFCFYFTGKSLEQAKSILMDIEAWGDGLTDSKVVTPEGRKIVTQAEHIDARSKSEYEFFKKYFSTPDIDLV